MHVSKSNGVYKLNRKPMSSANARKILIHTLTTAGLDLVDLGWRLLRRGTARDAHARGRLRDKIRSQDEGKTDSAKEVYVRRSLRRNALLSKTLSL